MSVRVVNVKGVNGREDRAGIVYVGRPWAGWPRHELANPFHLPRDKRDDTEARVRIISAYHDWLTSRPALASDLAALWEETEHGKKALGCWCVNATAGDGSPVVCHAQVLADLLHRRFVAPQCAKPHNTEE